MEKIDFKKTLKDFYRASAKKVNFVDVPAMNFFMIDGQGIPENNPYFQEAIEALYSIVYTIKFTLKFKEGLRPSGYFDFVIPPLESFWWMDNGAGWDQNKPEAWNWTMMIMQPDYINKKLIAIAKSEIHKKKEVKGLEKLKFVKFHEGKAAQMMHIGPYNEVERTTSIIINAIESAGFKFSGKHHEIYYNDPRRTAPEKLKTLVRLSYK